MGKQNEESQLGERIAMEKSKYLEISQKLRQAQLIQLEINPKKQQIETQKSRVAADLSNLNEVLSYKFY